MVTGCGVFGGGGKESPSPTPPAQAVDPEEWRAAAVDAYESLTVPDEFQLEARATFDPVAVPATEVLPGLVAASTYLPDERPQVGVWTVAADGVVGEPVMLDVGEYATSPVIATDGETTVIVGVAHEKAGSGLFVARSDDRTEWDIDFDTKLGDWTPIAATMNADGDVVVVGTKGGMAAGLVLSSHGSTEFELPEAQDSEGTSIVGVATDGAQVVVLRQMTDGPVVNVTDSVDSTDWKTIDLEDANMGTGVVRLPDGYLVAGSVVDDGYATIATAWMSVDGETWNREAVDPDATVAESSAVYGLASFGGRAQGVLRAPGAQECGLAERGEDGGWSVLVTSTKGCSFTRAHPLPRSDGGATVAVEGANTVVFDQAVPAGWVLSDEPREVFSLRPTASVQIGGDSRLYAKGFVVGANGDVGIDGALYAVENGAVVDVRDKVADEWVEVEGSLGPSSFGTSATTGETVVVGPAAKGLGAWRYATGGWERSAVSSDTFSSSGLAPVGNGWNLLSGYDIYSSPDGISWAKATDLFTVDDGRISPQTLCDVPGGESALILGTRMAADDSNATRPLAWLGADDTWRSVTVTDAAFGELTSCAMDGDKVVAGGATAEDADEPGVPGVWASANGRDWTAMELPENVTIGDLVAVDGGFSATGSVDGEPVVWLSDGTTWQWIPTPDSVPLRGVFGVGPDLVLYSSFGEATMTLLPGVADRIAQL